MLKYSKYLLILVMVFTSCKSKKAILSKSELKKLNTHTVLSNYNTNLFSGKTIKAKLKITYKSDRKSQSVLVKLRLDKDKKIWLSFTSLGIPIAKMLVTPQGVTFYEKIHRSFFNGDFSLIENWLGMPINFQNLQNVLLGQAFINLNHKKFNTSVSNQSYELKLKGKNNSVNTILWLNGKNFKIQKQKIKKNDKRMSIQIDYDDFKMVNNEILPKKIIILTKNKLKKTEIIISFKTLQVNLPLTFPFAVPKNYKKIVLHNFE